MAADSNTDSYKLSGTGCSGARYDFVLEFAPGDLQVASEGLCKVHVHDRHPRLLLLVITISQAVCSHHAKVSISRMRRVPASENACFPAKDVSMMFFHDTELDTAVISATFLVA
jgi:hypothetical protein